ncbi:MAG: hypothetical protein GWP10_00800 [Nitrospiraceae bacterium]|nr:hypothetical protein [Nitrospiraceae bacterium]
MLARDNIFKGIIKVLLLAILIFPLCPGSVYAEQHNRIAVVVSSEIRPYIMALDGLRSGLKYPLTVYYLSSNPELVRHRLGQERYDLVIAIGPEASSLTWSVLRPKDKKIAIMVLDPQDLLSDPDPCGVDLRVPMKEQIRLIVNRLGNKRKIGIPYNPIENKKWVEQAQEAGTELGVCIVPLAIHKRQEITEVLSSAYRHIDTLLFIPDSTVISEALLSHLVKDALLHGVAVVGYNHFFMEIGSVMAFSINYEKVGVLGAEVAKGVLSGSKCSLLPPPFKVEWDKRAWKTITQGLGAGKRRKGAMP